MKIRGQRRCQDCDHEWSYYETGEVACPACGSLRSVGQDDRQRHTDSPVTLDLSAHRTTADEASLAEACEELKSTVRAYRRKRGFISGGALRDLDDTFLAASELLHAADLYRRRTDPSDDERMYVLDLLRGADAGERPPPEAVPKSMAVARGLGYAEALDRYRSDVVTWLEDDPKPKVKSVLGTLRERLKRVEALQGDVSPTEAESLVRATREVTAYLQSSEETTLATARDRLGRVFAD